MSCNWQLTLVGDLIGAVGDFAKYLDLFCKSNRVVVLQRTVFIVKISYVLVAQSCPQW